MSPRLRFDTLAVNYNVCYIAKMNGVLGTRTLTAITR